MPTVRKNRKKPKAPQTSPRHLPAGRVQKARHPLISLGILFGIAVVIVGGLWAVASSGLVTNRFKPQLEQELSNALNRQVTVGRLEGGLLDRVVLRDVRISARATNPESLDIVIQRVVVQYSLWDILVRKRPLAESIYQIQLIRPLIQFERVSDGNWLSPALVFKPKDNRVAGPAVPAPVIPPIKLFLVSGEIRVKDGKHTTSIKNLKGLLNLKDPAAARLYLSGRTENRRLQNIKISGVLDLTAGSFRFGLTASRLELSPVVQVAHISDLFTVESGQADLEVQVQSRTPSPQDVLPGVGLKGKLVLYDLTMQTHLLKTPIKNIFGVAHLQDKTVTLKSMQAIMGKTTWMARGEIKNIHTPFLNIRVQSDKIELSDLIGTFPKLSEITTSGIGKAAILIRGTVPDLAITANFNMPEGKVGRLRIRGFEIITRYHARELRLLLARGNFAQGWIEGRGKITFPENEKEPAVINFRGDARDLVLEDIADIIGNNKIKGRCNGMLTVSGPVNTPAIFGEVSSSRISISGNVFKNIQGRMAYDNTSILFNLTTDWGHLQNALFHIEAHTPPTGGWILGKFTISRGSHTLLQASGDWGLKKTDDIHGQINTKDLPIQNIPLLPKELRHLNGIINLSGQVSGTISDPYLVGKFNTRKLTELVDGAIDGQGEIHITKKLIQLKNIWIDRKRIVLQGKVELGKQPTLFGEMNFSQAPLQHLASLGGLRKVKKVGGSVQGSIHLTGRLEQLKTKGEIYLRKLRWNDLQADSGVLNFSTNGRRVWIKEMELVQPNGKFNAVLETELGKNEGPFQVLAWMKTFTVGKRQWTGDFKVKGSFRDLESQPKYHASVNLDNLEVDGKTLPLASGTMTVEDNTFGLSDFRWGKEFLLNGHYSLGKVRKADLQLLLDKTNLANLGLVMTRDWKGLEENISGVLNLELLDKKLNSNLRINSVTGELQSEIAADLSEHGVLEHLNGFIQLQDFKTPTLLAMFLQTKPEQSPMGIINGKLDFQTSNGKVIQHSGNLHFTDFVFGQWNFKKLQTSWKGNGDQVELTTLDGIQPLGSLRSEKGSLHRNSDGSMALVLDLLADNFLFFSRRYHGHFAINGKLVIHPFDLQVDLNSPDFKLNLYPFDDFRASVHYKGEDLAIRTPQDYPYQIVGDLGLPPNGDVIFHRLTISDTNQVYIDTQGRIDGSGTTDLMIKVKNVPADVLARSLGWTQPWTGLASGSFRYTDPNRITRFDINVKIDNGSVLNLPFDTFYGNLILDHDWMNLSGPEGACVLRKYGKYNLLLSGKIPLPQSDAAAKALKGAEMDLHVQMPEGDLAYIAFVPYIAKASGKSSLDLRVKGTMDYPALNGRVTVENGTLYPRLYTPKIENFNADLTFDDNQVIANTLEGTIGKGRLRLSSGPTGNWITVFRCLQPYQLNLKLNSLDGPIHLDTTEDTEFVSADIKVDALLSGTMENPILGGTLEFQDGQFTFPVKLLSPFAKAIKPSNMAYDKLKLISRRSIWFYNDVVRAQIEPDQSVILDGGRYSFSAEGSVAIAKGSFTYLETDFSLDPNEETALICQGKEKPRLQSLAKTVIRNVQIKDEGRERDATIYLRVQGEIGALKIKLESDPVMTQAQIMSLLTLGEDYSNWSQEELDQKVQAAGARVLGRLAGNLLGREIEKGIKKITPIDVIDIRLGGMEKLADNIMTGNSNSVSAASNGNRSDFTGTSLLQDTQIDVGKYLTDDLFLNYRGILKDRGEEKGGLAWQSYFGMEYNLDASKKIKVYKNFDVDSNQEMFWGIEGRIQFEGWKPEEDKLETTKIQKRAQPSILPTYTPTINENNMNQRGR